MIKKIEKCPEIGKIYSDNEIYIICTGDGNVCVLNTFSGTVIQSNNNMHYILSLYKTLSSFALLISFFNCFI